MKADQFNRSIVYGLIFSLLYFTGCASSGRRFYSEELRPIKDIAIFVSDHTCRVDSIAEAGKPVMNLTGAGSLLGEILPGNYVLEVRYVYQGTYYNAHGKLESLPLRAEPGHVYYIYAEFPSAGVWRPSVIDILHDEDYKKAEAKGASHGNLKQAINDYLISDRIIIQKVEFTTKNGEHLILWR